MKRFYLFILAFLMAGVTTFLFYQYTQGMKAKAVVVSQVPMETVVVAKAEIPKATLITAKMVTLEKVPTTSVQPDALTSVGEVVGKLTLIDIQPNEMVLAHHVVSPQNSNRLSYKIKPGDRAVTITAGRMADTVANLIEPGDHVDVVLKTKTQDSTLLNNVLVLAVDQRMTESNSKNPYKPYTMTTLEVTPDQATQVLSSEQKGSLVLILRSAQKAS